MNRSPVWEETHLIPIRVKFQREGDEIIGQMPGYVLPEITVSGADHDEALARLVEHMRIYMGEPG